MAEWNESDFHRRHYQVESPVLDDARRIEVKIIVDGKLWVHMQAREPGLMAFVSRADAQGFDIEVVEAKGVRFTDHRTPAGEMTPPLAQWQKDALKL
jgi:hypothetical protein